MRIDAALREAVIGIAREAAVRILAVYEGPFDVEHKDDASPLTSADLAAHHYIVSALRALTPAIPVLSEESAAESVVAVRRDWDRLWLVDPLDGTREFVKRNGEFTVNIALVDNGVARYGVVQQPVTGIAWHGEPGRGAWRRDPGSDVDRPLQPRALPRPPWRVAASRSHRDARTDAFLAAMGDVQPIACGSSLKFCRIAQGDLDVYPRFGPTSEWDTAAGQCVLEGAGGAVIDPRGRPLRYNLRDTLLNGDFIALCDARLPWPEWLAAVPGGAA